jgi:hypothetical protein
MQTVHQKAFNKAMPFDGHLHCWSPLHSTAHRQNHAIAELNLITELLQPLCWVRDSLLSLISNPIGHLYINIT